MRDILDSIIQETTFFNLLICFCRITVPSVHVYYDEMQCSDVTTTCS